MTKEKAIEAIKDMPQDFQLDELIEKLLFVENVEEGIRQIKEGKGISHEEVKKKIEEWKSQPNY